MHLFFLCLFTLLAAFPAQGQTVQEGKVVRVGWNEDLYNNISINGERSGYVYEYEQSVAGYTGWHYQYVRAGWANLLQMLEAGEIDLLGGVSYTDERAQTMLFSELPMGWEKYYLYADLQHTGISAADLQTLNGKRIGVLAGSVQIPQFNSWQQKNNVRVEQVYIYNLDDVKKKVASRDIVGIISTETPFWSEAGMSIVATTGNSGIYFVVNKKRPDLKAELDNAMRRMEYDKPFYADDLYKRYFSKLSSATLAAEEKEWLNQHGAIRIGYLKHDAGFSSFDEANGKLVGVVNDYIKFATDCLGKQALKFELVGFDAQAEEIQALKDKKIDMIFHFSENPFFAEQNGFVLSNRVLTLPLAVYTAQDYFNENAENTVAIEKGNPLLRWHISYNYPQWKFVEYNSFAEVEEAVRSGKADCFLADSAMLSKLHEDKKLHSVFLTNPGSTAFAVDRENTVLLSILNKTLKVMSPSMLTSALSMYNSAAKKVTLGELLKEHWLAVTVSVIVLLVILVLLQKAKRAEAEAKKADEAKTAFLFNMSHDIRTPMNALLGYAKLMKEELKDPQLLRYQENMEQSGNLLLSIINNVLDMARIESGKIELEENYNRVGDILKEMCSVFDVEAKKRGIKLVYDADVEHEHIICDVIKLKEIFTNLLSNSLKYTPKGGTITMHTVEMPANKKGYVRIVTSVSDTGIGMSKEYLPHVFDTFTRERNTTTGKVAGTGLGMAIVKRLVEMMGGDIKVESELGKGSKFTVTLEHRIADKAYYKQDKACAETAAEKNILQGKHALLAEDNNLNAEIATVILERMGLSVDRVEDGMECVKQVEALPADTYDLILMDVQMPNMDGYSATRAIRNLADKEKAQLPIVAMTANAFEEDRKNAYDAGMNGHIAKPIDVEQVKKTLIAVLKK